MGILKNIFILLLLLLPLGEIIRIDLGNNIIVKPLDVAVGLVVFVWLMFKFNKRQAVRQKYIIFPVLLFASIGLFSLLINYPSLSANHFFASLLYLFRWITYAGIFFVVSEFDDKFRKKIVNLLIAVGALVVGLGYVQYFFYSNLKTLVYLGWDRHMYRMFSVFFDPNFAGAFFVLFFLLILNSFFKKKNILIGLLLMLTLGAVFLTFSRSALIMLIISSTLFFVFKNKKLYIGLLLGITFLVLSISSRYFNIENINLFRSFSSQARLETAKNAIQIIKDHPIFGVGFNSYRYAQIDYGFRNVNAKVSHADSGSDNSILFIIATTGIVGLVSYFFMWLKILKISSPFVVASIVGIFIDSLFVNSLFYTYIMLWLWIIIALSSSTSSEFKESK